MKQPKWILGNDGYHRNENNHDKGQSPFNKPIPPVRNADNMPLVPGSGGKVDWNAVYNERQQRGGGNGS